MYIPHRHLRLLRRTLGYSIGALLILVAVLLGIANELLPLAERHPDRVAHWLSQRTGRAVAFDGVTTRWTRRGPLLQLDNLRVGDGPRPLVIGDTEMLLSLYAGLLPSQPLSELRLRGLDLTLERLADGRWQVRGLPGQSQEAAGDPLAALEGLGELQVIGGRLSVLAPTLGIEAHIPRVDVRLRVDGARVRSGVRAWAAPGGQPLDAVLDLDRHRGHGAVYVGAKRVDLGDWSRLLRLAGVEVRGGQGEARAWASLQDHRVRRVSTELDLREVLLHGAPLDGIAPERRFSQVQARVQWRHAGGDWRLDAPRLRFAEGERTQALDGLIVAGGTHRALRAGGIDAGPLIAVAALSDRLAPPLRRWLREAQPQLSLHDVEIDGRQAGPLRVKARLGDIGFRPVGGAPGVQGLGGTLQGDAEGFSMRLDPRARMHFDWPQGFGARHSLALDGEVTGWREGDGWRIGTSGLKVDGDGYAATARGGLHWQGDGTRPRIDLATSIDEASVPVAKRFWVRHLMSPGLVKWLDTALVGGGIESGRAVVSGDLDDWPFTAGRGRFEASARIVGATLKFQPDWPAAEDLDADVRFLADGFTVDGRARLGAVEVAKLQGGIDRYRDGRLTVQAAARTDARELLALLRRSPLEKANRDTFANLSATGPTAATFELTLPLRPGAPVAIGGTVALEAARLADARWDVAFEHVRGTARYSQTGFHADDMQVRHEGGPGRLSLRAGPGHVREARNVFEAALDALVRADDLIERGPAELAWLKPLLEGRSNWSVGIAVPRATGRAAAPTLLQLKSNLVGTALELPAPLRKPASQAMAASVETPLPLGSGDVRIALGQVAAIRARSGGGRTGVRIALGTGQADEAPPAHGLVATGRAASLDAIDWIALAYGGAGEGEGGGLPLQRIDITAQRLNLLGGAFPNTRVVVAPAAAGATAVRVEGSGLEGALVIPAGKGAAVSGRFERLHWRPVRTAASGSGSETAAPAMQTRESAAVARAGATRAGDAPGTNDFSPSTVPPLSFDIDDLRIADARLGTAKLRTRPTPAGMRVEQLQARSPQQRLDMTGDWTGRGAAERTRIGATLASDDFGTLMTALGYGGRLGGGKGTVALQAGWPGGPAEFSVGSIEGSLELDARDGRLLEVEPGAGRVLGLLSLAELPRRLTLDFRDFFSKGFSFNRMGGTVRFADGSARSEDLRIDGPAASIEIRGAANLRAQRFDQTIEVHPKSGNLLTAVGALTGGPVGAALGAAANAVLRKPLGQIGARTYRVTGPWREPKVEVAGREQEPAPDVARTAPSD